MFPIIMASINPSIIIAIVVLVVLIGITVGLYFLGKRAQNKKDEQDKQAQATAQTYSMLIIDKKKMKLKNAGLPAQVVSSTPWYARNSKVPVVKAKVGPKIMTLIADSAIYDEIPVKKEVKATVSGLYIIGVKGIRGALEKPEGKKPLSQRLRDKYKQLTSK